MVWPLTPWLISINWLGSPQVFLGAPPFPNHSNPDLPPDRHEMDPVPSETTEAEQAPGRQRSVAPVRPITLFVAVRATRIAGSDPMGSRILIGCICQAWRVFLTAFARMICPSHGQIGLG